MYFNLPIAFRLSKLTDDKVICFNPDEYASYPGGSEAILKFITENLKWPKTESCFQGRVVIRFVVTKDGKTDKYEVVRGIDPIVDIEAINVIKMMPDFIPGTYKGKPVNTYFLVPVSFKI